jgi:hypothetical protein
VTIPIGLLSFQLADTVHQAGEHPELALTTDQGKRGHLATMLIRPGSLPE